MGFTCVFFGTLFLILGILFACGKGHIHLSQWKNMPREEKEKINIVPLCRNIGKVISLAGIIFLAKGLWVEFTNVWFVIAMSIWLILAGFDVLYIGKSGRFYKKESA